MSGNTREYDRAYYQANREILARQAAWRMKNPEAWNVYWWKRAYGLSAEEYTALFAKQKGCCAICGIHQSELSRRLAVDHSHSTGEVRSLLCGKCNAGLGHFNDNPELLEKASEYLCQHS